MKKTIRISVLAAFTLIGTASFGQSLNFSGGFTSSTMKGEYTTDMSSTSTFDGTTYSESFAYKNLSGYNASIGYEFKLGNRLSLETGFKYITRGYKIESEYSYSNSFYTSSEKSTHKYRLNYFDLPVVLNTAILTGDVKVYARTGIYIGLMTGGNFSTRSEYAGTDGNGSSESNEKISGDDMGDLSERIGGGFVMGVGAEFKGFFFEANYTLGTYSFEYLDDEMYTHDLSLSIGYKLKFNK